VFRVLNESDDEFKDARPKRGDGVSFFTSAKRQQEVEKFIPRIDTLINQIRARPSADFKKIEDNKQNMINLLFKLRSHIKSNIFSKEDEQELIKTEKKLKRMKDSYTIYYYKYKEKLEYLNDCLDLDYKINFDTFDYWDKRYIDGMEKKCKEKRKKNCIEFAGGTIGALINIATITAIVYAIIHS
jgi:hypothetical protein